MTNNSPNLPLISVIIPAYNCEKFILRTIRSILFQTYPNIEIVIIDDASTDSTRELMFSTFEKELSDKKVRYFKNEVNLERIFSRNRGAEIAQGEYLCFLDDDDLLDKDALKEMYILIKKKNVEFINQPRAIFIDEDDNIIGRRILPLPGSLIFKSFSHYPISSCMFVRKEIFQKTGGYDNRFIKTHQTTISDDRFLIIRMFLNGVKMSFNDLKSHKYRIHKNQTTYRLNYIDYQLKYYLPLLQEWHKNKIINNDAMAITYFRMLCISELKKWPDYFRKITSLSKFFIFRYPESFYYLFFALYSKLKIIFKLTKLDQLNTERDIS